MKRAPVLLTGSELCHLLGIRYLTFMKLRGEGMPTKKIGLRRVYDYDEVAAWLNARFKRLRGDTDWYSCTMK